MPHSPLQLFSRDLTFVPAHHTVYTTLFQQYRPDLKQLHLDLHRFPSNMRNHRQVNHTCARQPILGILSLTKTQMMTNRPKGLHRLNVSTSVTGLLTVRESGTLLHPDVVANPYKMSKSLQCSYTVRQAHIPRTSTSFAQRQKC